MAAEVGKVLGMENIVQQKRTKGRMKRDEIKRIDDKVSRQVTFSKRRAGLFKKCAELCHVCGANVAAVTFSEAGKLFSFGHPNVDAILHRYLNANDPNFGQNQHNDNYYYDNLIEQCEEDHSSSPNGFWFDAPVDNLGLEELEEFKVALERLRDNVASRLNEHSRSSLSLVPQNFGRGTTNEISRSSMNSSFIPQNFDCSSTNEISRSSMHSSLVPRNFNRGTANEMSLSSMSSSFVPQNFDRGSENEICRSSMNSSFVPQYFDRGTVNEINHSSMSLVPRDFDFGTTNEISSSSLMSFIPQNFNHGNEHEISHFPLDSVSVPQNFDLDMSHSSVNSVRQNFDRGTMKRISCSSMPQYSDLGTMNATNHSSMSLAPHIFDYAADNGGLPTQSSVNQGMADSLIDNMNNFW